MAANSAEIHSFVSKFLGLMSNGYDATLKFDSNLGECSVLLQCNLGRPLPPPTKHRNQSYFKRQQQRKVQKCSVSTQAEEADVGIEIDTSALSQDIAEEAITSNVKSVSNDEDEKAATTENQVVDDTFKCKKCNEEAEKVCKEKKCNFCDFTSTWDNGLLVHVDCKHNGKIDDDDKYERTKNYWKKGKLSSSYQSYIDANEILDEIDYDSDTMDTEKEKILEARKLAMGKSYYRSPPWSNNKFM